jgi:hypothetical protein
VFAILELVLAVFFAPFLIVYMVMVMAIDSLVSLFRNPFVVTSLGALGLAAVTWSHMTPDPEVPWNSLIDDVAQSHLVGIPLPYLAVALAVATLVIGLVVSARSPRAVATPIRSTWVPPMDVGRWPIIRVDGRYHYVNHSLGLMTMGFSQKDDLLENKNSLPTEGEARKLMRERYRTCLIRETSTARAHAAGQRGRE